MSREDNLIITEIVEQKNDTINDLSRCGIVVPNGYKVLPIVSSDKDFEFLIRNVKTYETWSSKMTQTALFETSRGLYDSSDVLRQLIIQKRVSISFDGTKDVKITFAILQREFVFSVNRVELTAEEKINAILEEFALYRRETELRIKDLERDKEFSIPLE